VSLISRRRLVTYASKLQQRGADSMALKFQGQAVCDNLLKKYHSFFILKHWCPDKTFVGFAYLNENQFILSALLR